MNQTKVCARIWTMVWAWGLAFVQIWIWAGVWSRSGVRVWAMV